MKTHRKTEKVVDTHVKDIDNARPIVNFRELPMDFLVVRNRHVVWMVFIIFLTRFSILALGWVLLLWVNQKVSTVLQTQNLVKNLTKKK